MKKIFLAAIMSALLLSQSPQAKAWGGGWGIAGAAIGGLAVGTAIGVSAHPVYYAPGPSYYSYPSYGYYGGGYAAPAYQAPAVVYAPAPGVVYGGPVVNVGFGYGGYGGYGWGRGYGGGYYGRGYSGHGGYRGYYHGRW